MDNLQYVPHACMWITRSPEHVSGQAKRLQADLQKAVCYLQIQMLGRGRPKKTRAVGGSNLEQSGEFSDELLTVSEIAAALKVPVSWVYDRARRSGSEQIPHFKLGKYLRFRWSIVQAWLENMKRQ
jgi:predicted DNA-binding transcriptional regulator AlpA